MSDFSDSAFWQNFECIANLSSNGSVNALAISGDGRTLVHGIDGGILITLDLETNQFIQAFGDRSAGTEAVVVSPDNQLVVASFSGEEVGVWNLHTGSQIRILEGDLWSTIPLAISSPSWLSSQKSGLLGNLASALRGKAITNLPLVAGGDSRGRVGVWNLETGKKLLTLESHGEAVSSIAITPDNTTLVSASADWETPLIVWDLNTGQRRYSFGDEEDLDKITKVAITPDGQLLVTCEPWGEVQVWRITASTPYTLLHKFKAHEGGSPSIGLGSTTSLAFSPDSQVLLSSGYDQFIRVWNLATGKIIHELKGHDGPVSGVLMTPDGKGMISSSFSEGYPGFGRIKIWSNG